MHIHVTRTNHILTTNLNCTTSNDEHFVTDYTFKELPSIIMDVFCSLKWTRCIGYWWDTKTIKLFLLQWKDRNWS